MWHRAHPPGVWWTLFFPATAQETLTKLEYETEEMSKRWAETRNGIQAHRHADGHLLGIYKIILVVNVIRNFMGITEVPI